MSGQIIGQQRLLGQIMGQVKAGTFPHFVILAGARGSGKNTVADFIGQQLGADTVRVDKSVEAVRNMVSVADKTNIKMLYVFQRAEELSAQAVNAMLKTIEEPPENVYFVFTTRNEQLLLETIRSRGAVYNMDEYSHEELQEYALGADVPIYCKTPYDVTLYNQVAGLDDFVTLVVENIQEVPISNALKIADRVALGGEIDKYDLNLFFEAFKVVCVERMRTTGERARVYYNWVEITARYQRDALRNGVNLKMLFDMWILDIRDFSDY